MPDYYCKACNYKTIILTHYNKHLETKKHKKCIQKLSFVTQKLPFVTQKLPSDEKKYPCKYCDKNFKYASGLSRHIKYTCKKNKDEDIKELVRLLNEQSEQNKMKDKEIEIMKKQINKLSNKLQIQNISSMNNSNNNNNNNIVNYNIQLLNYDNTDYSHLTEKDYFKCITDCNHCVKTLIHKVHFNDKKPENKNIYISNIKNKYIMLYKNNKWQIVNRKDQIDDLYEYNEYVLENWYDEYKNKYPDMIKSFERYLQNKDNDDELLNKVKDEILLMLYNNRIITPLTNDTKQITEEELSINK